MSERTNYIGQGMRTLQLIRISLLLLTFPPVKSVYFTELSYYTVIPSSLSVGEEVISLHVHSTPSVRHPRATGASVNCSLERVRNGGQDIQAHDRPFHLVQTAERSGTFRILVAVPLGVELISDRATYLLQVSCIDSTNDARCHSNVTVSVIRSNERRQTSSMCHHDVTFQLAENVKNVVLSTTWCSSRAHCSHNSADNCVLTVHGTKNNENYSGYLVLEESGQLTVERSFDREAVDQLTIAYRCTSSSSPTGPRTRRSSRRVCSAVLNILDTDDQGPWFQKREQGPVKYLEARIQLDAPKTRVLTTIATKDRDLNSTNHYIAYLQDDYNGLFSVNAPKLVALNGLNYSYYNTEVLLRGNLDPFSSNVSAYEVIVNIVDASFIPSFNAEDNNTAVYCINFQLQSLWKPSAQHPDFPSVFISASASIFSRVYYLGMNSTYYQIKTISDDVNSDVREPFAVTPREGIIYVNDASRLRELVNQSTVVVVKKCSVAEPEAEPGAEPVAECSFFLNLTVNVGDSVSTTNYDLPGQASSCSSFFLQSSCELASGLGSPTGVCVWRRQQSDNDSLTKYGTCSPYLITCPDEHCDELEMNVTELCPQDCTTKPPDGIGWAELNHLYAPPRGIVRAQSPCWCSGSQCKCGRLSGNFSGNETRSTETSILDEMERCGATCRLSLLAALSSLLVLTLIVVTWKCFNYRRKMTRMRGHGSGIVPSDYMVTAGSVTTDYTDYTTGHLLDMNHQNFLDMQADPKWEFNRADIKFESVLGEGEFGKVVKAKAWDIQGIPGHTTVAVKMLKECASGVEYRDLLSELNLLKQINHRNVIKLLGVCSRKGPLYVIVEFCEHGSLRSFLRRVRGKREHTETHNLSSAISVIQTDDGKILSVANGGIKGLVEDFVTSQDLLSFSWQIAKGMDYLSGMKVVHRDLAARNILLATGKVIKISDFGLSRDVYEGDAYLKTSKGPLPVKWMAPESLYDQICTTKSDIWSYGVVLWEIYTLGANPYPGTPAERLFQLLKTGFRMTKPASCSDELFSVMLHCWTDDPDKRPAFNQLADTFEKFLSLDTDYLDLNACENAVPDEQPSPVGLLVGDTQSRIENDDDHLARPDLLVNGHCKVPPRSMATAAPQPRSGDDLNGFQVSLANNIPSMFSGTSSTDSTAKNSSLIPLQNAKNNDRLNGPDHSKIRNQENEGEGPGNRGKLEVDEESNALLSYSTDF